MNIDPTSARDIVDEAYRNYDEQALIAENKNIRHLSNWRSEIGDRKFKNQPLFNNFKNNIIRFSENSISTANARHNVIKAIVDKNEFNTSSKLSYIEMNINSLNNNIIETNIRIEHLNKIILKERKTLNTITYKSYILFLKIIYIIYYFIIIFGLVCITLILVDEIYLYYKYK
jgi:hypothetical protein